MKYEIHTVEGVWQDLEKFLNSLSDYHEVVSIHPGRHGKWHGLAEEYEHGFKVVVLNKVVGK